MMKNIQILLAGGLLVVLADGFLTAQAKSPSRTETGAAGADAGRKADEGAIRKLSGQFSRALEKGDPIEVADFWTEEGEYVAAEGTTLRGRKTIEEAYAKFFAKKPHLKVQGNIDSVRFLSKDSAIEEGTAKSQEDKADQPTFSRYSVLWVREDGRWLMGEVREWPDEGITLHDIDWLIGTWAVKTEEGEARSTYEWAEGKQFIRVQFSINGKEATVSGMQMIGKDPTTGQLHSWIFGSEGGVGEAAWSRDGKRWVLEATGVREDGSQMTATNILTPIDGDSFTWQSINRTAGGEEVPDVAPVKATRVK